MRLLIVLADYPIPMRTGSAIVACSSIRGLQARHQIDIICPLSSDGNNEFGRIQNQIEFVARRKVSRLIGWIRSLFYMLKGVPPAISTYASRAMNESVRNKLKDNEFDAILLFEMSAMQYCPSSWLNKVAVNIEDPQSIRLNRLAQLPIWSLWRKLKLLIQTQVMAHYENRILHKAGQVFLLSKNDARDFCKQFGYKNIACLPYGVEQRDSLQVLGYQGRERAIVFSGNMFHAPNVDGGLFLLTDIFPLILRSYPSAVLWIVGADPDARLCAEAEKFGKSVVVTGRVDDVSNYIKRATVSICPVRLKIGVQTKILESLSWGTPVVTTSAGNSGIGGINGKHLWVEDESAMLAQRVCELLRGQNWEKLSIDGRQLVIENFSWESSANQLERHLEALVAKS